MATFRPSAVPEIANQSVVSSPSIDPESLLPYLSPPSYTSKTPLRLVIPTSYSTTNTTSTNCEAPPYSSHRQFRNVATSSSPVPSYSSFSDTDEGLIKKLLISIAWSMFWLSVSLAALLLYLGFLFRLAYGG